MAYLVGKKIKLVKFTDKYITEDYLGWLNDHEMSKYLCTGRLPVSRGDITVPIGNENIRFAILISVGDSDKYVGTISLHNIDWIIRKAEIGYMISKEHWGQGIASEAVCLISDYALNRINLHKVEAGVVEGNNGSIKVLEKNGFKEYAKIPDEYYLDGKYHNVIRFYKLNENK